MVEFKNIFLTRLHSSRMHTARLLAVSPIMHCRGGVCSGGLPAPGGFLLLGGVLLLGGLLQGVGAWSMEGVVSQHGLRQTPLRKKITDSCKNITFPQLRLLVRTLQLRLRLTLCQCNFQKSWLRIGVFGY